MINLRNMSATDAYTTRLGEVQAAMSLLQRKIEAHAKGHPSKSTNWAHVGDLTLLLATLQEACVGGITSQPPISKPYS